MFDNITPLINEARISAARLREAADAASRVHTAMAGLQTGTVISASTVVDLEKEAVADFAENILVVLERLALHQRVGF